MFAGGKESGRTEVKLAGIKNRGLARSVTDVAPMSYETWEGGRDEERKLRLLVV